MLAIFTHTPIWVWLLLTGLCVLGLQQTRTRQISLQRVLILPCVMLILALHSMLKGSGSAAMCLGVWGLTTTIVCMLIVRRESPQDHRYDQVSQKFTIPGSWLPLMLMLGMFIAKYAMNVSLAIRPELAQQNPFALSFSIIFGIFNGVFLARPLRLLKLKNQCSFSSTEMAV